MDLIQRPRRLRGSETLRKMVRETRIDKSSLIYPLFVKEGTGIEEEIPSMEGQYRYSVDRLPYELERLPEDSSRIFTILQMYVCVNILLMAIVVCSADMRLKMMRR